MYYKTDEQYRDMIKKVIHKVMPQKVKDSVISTILNKRDEQVSMNWFMKHWA